MSNVPRDLRYTKEHEWGRLESDGRITVGITDYAQDQLGDIVFLDLPDVGDAVTGGEPLGEIESTKSVSDIYSPVTGSVAEINLEARENPAVINTDPYGEGWMLRLAPDDPAEYQGLLTAEEYEQHIAEEQGED